MAEPEISSQKPTLEHTNKSDSTPPENIDVPKTTDATEMLNNEIFLGALSAAATPGNKPMTKDWIWVDDRSNALALAEPPKA